MVTLNQNFNLQYKKNPMSATPKSVDDERLSKIG